MFMRKKRSICMLAAALLSALIVLLAGSQGIGGEKIALRTEFQDIIPKFLKLPDGRCSGISYEIMKMVERRSGIVFSFSEFPVPVSRVVMDLQRGDTDVQFGLQMTEERERALVVGEPLYAVKTVTLMRCGDVADFSSLDGLGRLGPEKGRILTVWGTGTAAILGPMKGLFVDDSAKTVEDALRKLVMGRGRVLIHHNLSLLYMMKSPEYAGRLKPVALDYGNIRLLNDARQYAVFSKKMDPRLVRRINSVIRESRADGELEQITSKYLR